MLAAQPELEFLTDSPIDLVEHPVAVPDSEVGTPSDEDRVELLDDLIKTFRAAKGTHGITDALQDVATCLLARPEIRTASGGPKVKPQEAESLRERRQPTLLMVDHQSKFGELLLE